MFGDDVFNKSLHPAANKDSSFFVHDVVPEEKSICDRLRESASDTVVRTVKCPDPKMML